MRVHSALTLPSLCYVVGEILARKHPSYFARERDFLMFFLYLIVEHFRVLCRLTASDVNAN
jgi:hypothetical protein